MLLQYIVMDKKTNESNHDPKQVELARTVERLANHNYELKSLILRHGDNQIKVKLEKLMKKYSGVPYEDHAA